MYNQRSGRCIDSAIDSLLESPAYTLPAGTAQVFTIDQLLTYLRTKIATTVVQEEEQKKEVEIPQGREAAARKPVWECKDQEVLAVQIHGGHNAMP